MKELKYLFCNIGWMKHYRGITADDKKPKSGGTGGIGGEKYEVCNFSPNEKKHLFGYVRPSGGRQIKLENIVNCDADASKKEEENVFVIWTATRPKGGQVVIGWYRNATVYRVEQPLNPKSASELHRQNEYKIKVFRIKADSLYAGLLPEYERTIELPKQFRGVWYGDDSEGKGKKLARNVWMLSEGYAHDSDNLRPDEVDPFRLYHEGATKKVFVNTYERNEKARKDCIKHYGHKCQVCDFDFKGMYGDIGKDFIHVHHKTPFSEISGEYEVNPIKDLIPVCPNCHAMIHKKRPALTVNEMKKILRENKKNK